MVAEGFRSTNLKIDPLVIRHLLVHRELMVRDP